jgi:hypothetical protein
LYEHNAIYAGFILLANVNGQKQHHVSFLD